MTPTGDAGPVSRHPPAGVFREGGQLLCTHPSAPGSANMRNDMETIRTFRLYGNCTRRRYYYGAPECKSSVQYNLIVIKVFVILLFGCRIGLFPACSFLVTSRYTLAGSFREESRSPGMSRQDRLLMVPHE